VVIIIIIIITGTRLFDAMYDGGRTVGEQCSADMTLVFESSFCVVVQLNHHHTIRYKRRVYNPFKPFNTYTQKFHLTRYLHVHTDHFIYAQMLQPILGLFIAKCIKSS